MLSLIDLQKIFIWISKGFLIPSFFYVIWTPLIIALPNLYQFSIIHIPYNPILDYLLSHSFFFSMFFISYLFIVNLNFMDRWEKNQYDIKFNFLEHIVFINKYIYFSSIFFIGIFFLYVFLGGDLHLKLLYIINNTSIKNLNFSILEIVLGNIISSYICIFYIILLSYIISRIKSFNIAKMSFQTINDKYKRSENIKYLQLGFYYYNRYLQKKIDWKIKDIQNIVYKFAFSDSQRNIYQDYNIQQNKSLYKVTRELVDRLDEDDPIKSLQYLKRFLNIEKESEFLIKEKVSQKIQIMIPVFAAMMPAIAAITIAIFKLGK